MPNKPDKIIVHHDGVSRAGASLHIVDAAHKERDFPLSSLGYYVGYHWVIERDGTIARTRNDNEVGAHTVGQNDKSIGIFLAGNFDVELPTRAQERELGVLLHHYCDLLKLDEHDIFPHRAFAQKSCYGNKLGDTWAAFVYLQHVITQYQARLDDLGKV